MLRLIVAKELRARLGSATFVWSFAVTSVLIVLTFFIGARSFHHELAQYEAETAESLRRLEGLTTWLEARPVVSMPPDPVACLVRGVSNDIGRSVEVLGRGPLRAEGSRYASEPLLATFRLLDLEFVFAVVLSLLALVLAHDAVSGEKQSGTLRLVFSNPVPRHLFILGKMAGAFLGLTGPLLIPLLLGALLLVVLGIPMTPAHWLKLALVIGAGLVYVGAFTGLAVWVSALTRRPSTSMLVLLVVWVLAVLVVPRVALLAAARTVEVPSMDEVLSARSRLRAQLWREDRETMDGFWQAPERQHSSVDGEQGMGVLIGQFNELMQEMSAERQERLGALERELMQDRGNRQRQQRRLGLGLARLSPAAVFSLAATRCAGTSLELVDHFHGQVRSYQEGFERFQRERTGGHSSGEIQIIIQAVRAGEQPASIDPHELPSFRYSQPSVADCVSGAVADVGLLGLYAVLFFTAGYVAFLRCDVR